MWADEVDTIVDLKKWILSKRSESCPDDYIIDMAERHFEQDWINIVKKELKKKIRRTICTLK